MKGTVKFFNQGKGFGFIACEDGKEVFVHQTALDEGVVLNEGDAVEFDVVEGDRGQKAENVKKVDDTEPETEEATDDAEEDTESEDSAEEPEEEKEE